MLCLHAAGGLARCYNAFQLTLGLFAMPSSGLQRVCTVADGLVAAASRLRKRSGSRCRGLSAAARRGAPRLCEKLQGACTVHRGPALSCEACGTTEIVKAAQEYEAVPVVAYRAHALQGSPHPAKCRSPLRSHTLPAITQRHQACYSQCAYLLFILAQARTYACSPPQQPFQADCEI